jgi:hypothetical protein
VSTIDPRCNILRVADRVGAGGHDVPSDKIVERYYRSLSLLPLAIEIADRVTLVDNTEFPMECARAWQGNIQRAIVTCPDWVETVIASVAARKKSRETFQRWINRERLQVAANNYWSGSYSGEILQMDDCYLLQIVDERVVMHDRLLLRGDYSIGSIQVINYQAGVG